jgi:hypothetical protein
VGRRQQEKDRLQSGRAKRDESILEEHLQSDVHHVATATWVKENLQYITSNIQQTSVA